MDNETFLTVDLGRKVGKAVSFASPDELRKWSEEEMTFLQKLADRFSQSNTTTQIRGNIDNNYRHIISELDKDPTEIDKERIQNFLQNIYVINQTLYSKSSEANFVMKISEFDIPAAINLYEAFREQKQADQINTHIRAFGYYWLFKNGLEGADAHQKALQALQFEYAETLQGFRGESSSIKSQGDHILAEASSALSEAKESFGKFRDESGNRIRELEYTFNEKLALSAPAEYWKSRHKSLGRWSILYALIFIIVLVGSGSILYFEIKSLSNNLGQFISGQPGDVWIFSSRVLLVAIVAALAFWPLKIISRLFLSNMHLQTDAKERSLLVTTYLALSKSEDAPLKAQDRSLILAALFRPTPHGIVNEEESGLIFLDILKNLNRQ